MTSFILAPYVRIGFLSGNLYFGFGSLRRVIKSPDLQAVLVDAAHIMRTPHTLDKLRRKLKDHGYSEKLIKSCLSNLDDRYLISADRLRQPSPEISQQLYYGLSGAGMSLPTDVLSKKSIAIIGCGGIANALAYQLAMAGIGRLVLIDGAQVDANDLIRNPLFTHKNIGEYKTKVLEKSLLCRAQGLRVDTVNGYLDEENLHRLEGMDLVVNGVGERALITILNKECVAQNIPLMPVRFVEDIAYWGPLVVPGQTGCLFCQVRVVNDEGTDPETLQKCKEINSGYIPPYNPSIYALAASLASLDIVRFLGDFGEVHSLETRIGLWTDQLEFEKQSFQRNKACAVCSK